MRSHDDGRGGEIHLYDGGEFSPYCVESLLDLLRSESRATRRALEMSFEILGPCSALRLQEVATRFATAAITGLSVTVRANGHPPLRVGESAPVERSSSSATPGSRSS